MTRLYVDSPLVVDEELELPSQVAHRVAHVLRLRVGTELTVFNGTGGEYAASLIALTKSAAVIQVQSHRAVERESILAITLAQGISRGERMDYSIQKAVELGVRHIVPLQASRTNVKLTAERSERRRDHWHGIIRHACEQCGRNRLPTLSGVQTLSAVLEGMSTEFAFVLDPLGTDSLTAVPATIDAALLLVGPEGGFDAAELDQISAAGVKRLRLGERTLRTETATVAGLSVLQSRYGDFRCV